MLYNKNIYKSNINVYDCVINLGDIMKLTEAAEIITFKTGIYIDRCVLHARIKKGEIEATKENGRPGS